MYHPQKFHVLCKNPNCEHQVKDEDGKVIGKEHNKFIIGTPTAIKAPCPYCNEEYIYQIPNAPVVRSKIKPIGEIHVYRITSEEIKVHLMNKIKYYCPGSKLELGVKYCERKKGSKDGGPHPSYASLTIAFSDHVIDQKGDIGWFDKIGESETNVRLIDDVYTEFIKKFRYDRKALEFYLNDYKELEKLEDSIGINETFLEDIRMYTTPRRIPTSAKESWVFFSARPEKVIEDMLENNFTDTIEGRVHISEVRQIHNDVVKFLVYVHPGEMGLSENPLVRQMLTGQLNTKAKK